MNDESGKRLVGYLDEDSECVIGAAQVNVASYSTQSMLFLRPSHYEQSGVPCQSVIHPSLPTIRNSADA